MDATWDETVGRIDIGIAFTAGGPLSPEQMDLSINGDTVVPPIIPTIPVMTLGDPETIDFLGMLCMDRPKSCMPL